MTIFSLLFFLSSVAAVVVSPCCHRGHGRTHYYYSTLTAIPIATPFRPNHVDALPEPHRTLFHHHKHDVQFACTSFFPRLISIIFPDSSFLMPFVFFLLPAWRILALLIQRTLSHFYFARTIHAVSLHITFVAILILPLSQTTYTSLLSPFLFCMHNYPISVPLRMHPSTHNASAIPG